MWSGSVMLAWMAAMGSGPVWLLSIVLVAYFMTPSFSMTVYGMAFNLLT